MNSSKLGAELINLFMDEWLKSDECFIPAWKRSVGGQGCVTHALEHLAICIDRLNRDGDMLNISRIS